MKLTDLDYIIKNKNIKLYFLSTLVGVLTGLVVVAYRLSLTAMTTLRIDIFSKIDNGDLHFLFIVILAFIFIAIILDRLIHRHPMIRGSGLPQVKGLLLMQVEYRWFKELIYKFVGGVLSVGSGLSLGRGGPSIQLGSQVAYGVRNLTKTKSTNEKFLISSGISAGLSAAFNSPFSGIVFAIEEVHKYITPALLICISLASISSEIITRTFLGEKALFNFKGIIPVNLAFFEKFIYIFLLAIIVGVLGVLFTTGLLKFQKFYSKLKMSSLKKSLIIFSISIFIGVYLLDIQGVGYRLIVKAGELSFSFKFLAFLLFGKLLFTILSNAPGFPGGLFLPSLVLGALIGDLFATGLSSFFNQTGDFHQYFMVLGMAAFLTAVMRTPLTANVLLLEMTGSFNYLPDLMFVTIVTYIFTDLLEIPSISSVLYDNLAKNKGIQRTKLSTKSTIFTSPVVGGSWLDGMEVRKVKWPFDSLLIKIQRDNSDLIPHGTTKILSGDILFILTTESREKELKPIIFDLGTEPRNN